MVTIGNLWLPIVVATVLCFVAGALLHMVLPLHRKDFVKLPDEDGVVEALRRSGTGAGNYMFPAPAGPEAMKDPAFLAKFERGPAGILTIRPAGKLSMGGSLTKQFLFHLVISFVIAYLASRTLNAGAEYLHVFRVTGTAAILAYVAAIFPAAIWYAEPPGYVLGKVVDGVVWGLLTAGSFGGFWPA
jgi:nucleoside recognition membrane protein YjiH